MIIINDIKIKDRYVHNLPENRELLGYARKNRKAGNLAEIEYGKQVHGKMFHGMAFDRKKVIGNDKENYDTQRDKYLEGLGLKVFHTTDYDVLQHVSIVLADLRKYIVDNYEHED